MAYRLGVDVGGTFTDLFLVNDEDDLQFRVKTPIDAGRPVARRPHGRRAHLRRGRHRAVRAAQHRARHDGRDQRGAREQGRARRPDHDDGLQADPAPRALADAGPAGGLDHHDQARPAGARSRTRARRSSASTRAADVVTPVDREQVKGIVRDLVDSGVESLTVGLINSYVNSAHEEEIGAIVEELYPGFPVTLSSHVLPEFREYERTLTACMNSYVRPTVATYVKGLQSSLKELGTTCDVNILRSDAGLMTTTEAQRNPIYGVLSGPVRRRRRGAARRRQGGLPEHPHVRHGRDVHRRRAVPERRADDRARDVDQPLPHQDPERQRAHGRRGRRLDRARAASSPARSASGRSRPAPSPARRPTARAARSRP